MREVLAAWLLRAALRLDPHDPFSGLQDVDIDRGIGGRWLLIARFQSREQAATAQSYLLHRKSG